VAYLKCPFIPPEGFPKKVYPLGCEVEIIVGLCSCADLCKNTICPFYDVTEEGTKTFCQTQWYENTEEALTTSPRVEGIDEAIFRLLIDVYNLPKNIADHNRKD
jgi:hypothetical protein